MPVSKRQGEVGIFSFVWCDGYQRIVEHTTSKFVRLELALRRRSRASWKNRSSGSILVEEGRGSGADRREFLGEETRSCRSIFRLHLIHWIK